jgi:hypothetical protein
MAQAHKLILLLAILALASCAPNPRDQAELVRAQSAAIAAETEARQAALDAEQARVHQAALDRIAEGEAVHRQAAITDAIALFAYALAGSLAVIAVGAAISLSILGVGRSTTSAIKSSVEAMTIKPDPETGAYPLLVAPSQVARAWLANPNTGSVRLLNAPAGEQPLLVRSAHHQQTTIQVARQARLAAGEDNAAYVSGVRQPILQDEDEAKNDDRRAGYHQG